jgi:NADH-quinone oxidoreductase subunit C
VSADLTTATSSESAALAAAVARALEADLAALAELPAVETDVLLGASVALVPREGLLEAARRLQERGYNLLASVTAVDFLPSEPRFQVVYLFVAVPAAAQGGDATPDPTDPPRRVRVKVPVPDDDPVVPSLVDLYPGANWHEREVWDMFGIQFAGHPDPRRILMPDDYEGHPLRKDHPLRYEEVAFTHNVDEVHAHKHFAERS